MVLGRNFQASLQHDHAAVKAQVRERERLLEVYVETVAPPERVSGRDRTGFPGPLQARSVCSEHVRLRRAISAAWARAHRDRLPLRTASTLCRK
jgi:hypothetical protein